MTISLIIDSNENKYYKSQIKKGKKTITEYLDFEVQVRLKEAILYNIKYSKNIENVKKTISHMYRLIGYILINNIFIDNIKTRVILRKKKYIDLLNLLIYSISYYYDNVILNNKDLLCSWELKEWDKFNKQSMEFVDKHPELNTYYMDDNIYNLYYAFIKSFNINNERNN